EEEAARCAELFGQACSSTGWPDYARPFSLRVYAALARLAGRWPTGQAVEWLGALSADVHSPIQAEALRSLARREEKAPGRFKSHDPAVRAATVACGELSDVLVALGHDEDASVRIALAERLRSTTSPTLCVLQSAAP